MGIKVGICSFPRCKKMSEVIILRKVIRHFVGGTLEQVTNTPIGCFCKDHGMYVKEEVITVTEDMNENVKECSVIMENVQSSI